MTRSKRGALTLTIVSMTALAIALAGCSSSGGGTPAPAKNAVLAAASTCSSGGAAGSSFRLGSFLPLTGSLASLGPAAVAGAGEALSEINAEGGVNGKKACIISTDSSDTTNPTIGNQSIQKLLGDNVSAILGAESSSVTENVLSTVTASGTVMFSPANTDDALTGISKWYFRDAPPNSVEGNALGKQIVANGASKVGILVFNDSYGTNLRDSIQKSIEGAGGSVVYGATGKGQEFPATETTFGNEVSAVLATKPDAIVVDAFDQTNQILPALASAGWNMKNTYFVDGNLNDYTTAAGIPDLSGAQGSTQGVNPSPAFKTTLTKWYAKNEAGAKLGYFGYAAESYDAVMIMALAADESKSDLSAKIQSDILPITGSNGGTVCKSYTACLADIKAGKKVHFEGLSGIGPLNAGHDPSSGFISIYQYVGKAPSKFLESVKGSV
jgi:neutral amino acid transport system substrate-binding protein